MPNGIVRRIDDLGRIVLPKEIRRVFRIREGDPLEIIASEGCISIIPYRIKDFREVALPWLKTYYKQFQIPAAICDRHEFIAWKGLDLKPYTKISDSLEFHIYERTEYIAKQQEAVDALADSDKLQAGAIFPINADDDKVGGIVLFLREGMPITAEEMSCARFMAAAISDQLSVEG